MSIRIVADSTFALRDDYVADNNITVVPLNVIVDGVSYQDNVSITIKEVLESLNSGSKVTTSQPSPELFIETFEKLISEGATEIICMTISSTLSGTYNSAQIAKSEFKDVKIHLVDTYSTSIGAEMLLNVLVADLKAGKTVDKTIEKVEKLKKKGVILMTMENLNALKQSGRLSKIKAAIGNLIKVKPVIEYIEGKVVVNTKSRTEFAVVSYIIDRIKKDYEIAKDRLIIYISHVQAETKILKIKERLEEIFSDIKIHISREISPVVSINLGYGGFGISWYYE